MDARYNPRAIMQINDKSMVCTHRFSRRVCANEGLMPTARFFTSTFFLT